MGSSLLIVGRRLGGEGGGGLMSLRCSDCLWIDLACMNVDRGPVGFRGPAVSRITGTAISCSPLPKK